VSPALFPLLALWIGNVASGEVSYHALWDERGYCTYANAFGDAWAGRGILGTRYDLRLADDIKRTQDAISDFFTGDCMSRIHNPPREGAFVRVHVDSDGVPKEPPIFEERVVNLDVEFMDHAWECGPHAFAYPRITVRNLSLRLPAGKFWIGVQPVDTAVNRDWFYQLGSSMHGSRLRFPQGRD